MQGGLLASRAQPALCTLHRDLGMRARETDEEYISLHDPTITKASQGMFIEFSIRSWDKAQRSDH